MLNKLINLFRNKSNIKTLKRMAKAGFVSIDRSSIVMNTFRLEMRNPTKGKEYLLIGKNSIVDGTYIFEKETGHISIGSHTHVGKSTFISIDSISIGNDVTIAWDCLFYDHNSHSVFFDLRKEDTIQEILDYKETGDFLRNKNWAVVKTGPIIICDKVWIGLGCKILKGVTIGEGAVIAAGSVVVKDIPPWTLAGGNPAKPIKPICHQDSE